VLFCGVTLVSTSYAAPFDRFLMPGKLVESHKKFETTCDKCHEAFDKQEQNKLCLSCHKKVNKDVKAKLGFHGKEPSVKLEECKNCHTDHIGRSANIVNLDKSGFDHRLTDFLLKGGHKKTRCESCHARGKKYRDAPHLCLDCHKEDDIHQSRMGKKCQDCHSESDWKKTKFDHDKTKYKLKGKHKKVNCGDCHPNQRFKATPVICIACHKVQDVHRGEFGSKCEKCHNTKKWNEILFDHDKTKFKLRFRHDKISCGSCHVKNIYKVELKKDCYSCHKSDDKHNTQFSNKCEKCHQDKSWEKLTFNHDKDTKFRLTDAHKKASCQSCHFGFVYKEKLKMVCDSCHKVDDIHNGNLGKNCARCHSQKNWWEKIVFDHDLTKFPLIGLHGLASCEACHSSTDYKIKNPRCYACHESEDVHKLKLTKKCESCHTPNGWKVWLFSHNDETDYKLDGEHELVECVACHKDPIVGKKKIVLSDKCVSCHSNDDTHSGKFGKRCEKCHSTDSFKNITKLN